MPETPSPTYTRDQIADALNAATDQIQELAPFSDLVGDATNLLVNAALHYLDAPHDSLIDVVEANYDDGNAEGGPLDRLSGQ